MNYQKHTPGPWTIAQCQVGTLGGDNWEQYREVIHPTSGPTQSVTKLDQRTSEADARLIAAAPDLLEALEGAEKCIVKALPYVPADDEAHFLGEWLGDIRKVIAKAKGEAP